MLLSAIQIVVQPILVLCCAARGAIPATGRTKAEIAQLLGISRQHLYDILREPNPVSPAVAVRLLTASGPAAPSSRY